jgi:AraC-like DNA-binding protein
MTNENRVKVWRVADLHDAVMLKGAYVRPYGPTYPWHAHEELSLGLVIDGAINLRTRSREGVAKPGSIELINAEEVHQGTPAVPEGWRCLTIHIHPGVIRSVAQELKSFTPVPSVAFQGPTFEDVDLARELLDLHCCSEMASSSLERQSRIVALIARLLARHADTRLQAPARPQEPLAVRRALAYLNENLSDKVTLDELAASAGITPFRLLRAFQQALGLTPHAYQTQARVRMAHAMVRRQASLADVAAATGFADQAHLTRVFKSIMGATPGQYRTAALAA